LLRADPCLASIGCLARRRGWKRWPGPANGRGDLGGATGGSDHSVFSLTLAARAAVLAWCGRWFLAMRLS